jgi:hypothetical protein
MATDLPWTLLDAGDAELDFVWIVGWSINKLFMKYKGSMERNSAGSGQ